MTPLYNRRQVGVLVAAFAVWAGQACGQYSENFENVLLVNFTGTLPAGWKQYNLDYLTPAGAVNWIGSNGWVVRDTWWDVGGSKAAASVSHYTPPGASDDWMVTPPIAVPVVNPYLRWKASAAAPGFQDGYQVWIVPAGATPCNPGDFPSPCDFLANAAQKIFETSAAPETFQSFGVSLASWAGQTVHLAWRNNSFDKYVLYIDDIEVLSLPNHYDVALEAVEVERFVPVGQNALLHIRIRNNLGLPVNNLNVSWTDGNNTHTQALTGLNIPPGGTYDFVHMAAFSSSVVGEYNLAVTVLNPNGQPDANPTDNTLTQKVSTVGAQAPKVVVIEEGTGTSCGWCPRGYTAMEHMYNLYAESFAGIAVHFNDPMEVPGYEAGLSLSYTPACQVDRHLKDAYVSAEMFEIYYNNYKNIRPPAALTVIPVAAGNLLNVEVRTHFLTTCTDEFRLAVVLTENGVRGAGPDYAQTNYYAGGSQSMPYGSIDFMTQPNPVPDSVMWYDHTARALLGGYEGQANSIPTAAFVNGNIHTYAFSYTLPPAFNINNMEAIALLIESATGRIWNAGKAKISTTSSIEEVTTLNFNAALYPNPAVDAVNLIFTLDKPEAVQVNLYDLRGRLLMHREMGILFGQHQISLPVNQLPKGHYLLSVATPRRAHTERLVVAY
jgi:hypothetical protein